MEVVVARFKDILNNMPRYTEKIHEKYGQNGRCYNEISNQPLTVCKSEVSPFRQTTSSACTQMRTLPSEVVIMAALGVAFLRNNQIFHQRTESNFPGIPHESFRNSFGITCKWLPFLFHIDTHSLLARQQNYHNTRIQRIRRVETKCRR